MGVKLHHIKPVIYTTSKDFWFKKYFEEILATQRSSEGVIVDDFEVIYIPSKDVKMKTLLDKDGQGVVDWDWFNEKFTLPAKAMGFNKVGFHFDSSDQREWGLNPNTHGTYVGDKDDIYEYWICCSRNQKPRSYATTKYAEFVRLELHEAAHGFTHFAGVREELMKKFNTYQYPERDQLPTHYFDYVVRDIKQIYYHISFKKWSTQVYILELLRQVVALIGIQMALPKVPTVPGRDMLKEWALAIQEFEGYKEGYIEKLK